MPKLKQKKHYLDEELVLLCAIYSRSSFSAGDDESDECKRIAYALGRSPGTIDMQWRNIKAYLAGTASHKVGAKVKFWTQRMLDDPQTIVNLAREYCDIYGWDVTDLLD